MSECPTCGDVFDGESGMKVHHANAHGESIAKTECECAWCGADIEVKDHIYDRTDNNFCDESCRGEWLSENNSGEPHPNYDKHSLVCDWCGCEFSRGRDLASKSERDFCTQKCYGKWLSENNSGEDHHQYNRVSYDCDYCGSNMSITPYDFEEYTNHYCSKECSGSHKKELYSGEGGPSWSGGWPDYYGPNWDEQREKVLDVYGRRCASCGKSAQENGKGLDVHHVTPIREFKDDSGDVDYESANEVENLVPFCPSCHRKWEGVRVRPQPPGSL